MSGLLLCEFGLQLLTLLTVTVVRLKSESMKESLYQLFKATVGQRIWVRETV